MPPNPALGETATDVPVPAGARIRRHSLRTRLLHAANALALLVLLATGLALGDRLTPSLVAAMGGHEAINAVHQQLGLAFAIAALVLAATLGGATRRLLYALLHYGRQDLRWPVAFLRHTLRPTRAPQPQHGGYFDPLERLVLTVLLLATAAVALTGVYLYWLPDAPRWVFVLMMRTHIRAAWVLLAALALHIFAGLGVLRTHRGLLRAMFGDGTLPLHTARTLWPQWVREQRREDSAPRG